MQGWCTSSDFTKAPGLNPNVETHVSNVCSSRILSNIGVLLDKSI